MYVSEDTEIKIDKSCPANVQYWSVDASADLRESLHFVLLQISPF